MLDIVRAQKEQVRSLAAIDVINTVHNDIIDEAHEEAEVTGEIDAHKLFMLLRLQHAELTTLRESHHQHVSSSTIIYVLIFFVMMIFFARDWLL